MHKNNLLPVALLSLVAVGICFWSTQATKKRKTSYTPPPFSQLAVPEELRNELLSRVVTFFGEEGYKKLNNSFVVVVGLGGVGSHAVNMLVRSGVGRVRIIDFDQVSLSSLNRHALATWSDVGTSKADAVCRRLKEIVPWCCVEAITEMFKADSAARLLAGEPDYVLDCIDDVNTKAELIAFCKKNNLTVLTSMGAGGKADPTRMRIAPLTDCINDPLAQKIKWKLKKHQIAPETVTSVFSIEKPIVDLLPLDDEQKAAPQDFGAVDYLRLRVIPVLGTSPSIFGQAMASYVLCNLAEQPYEPEACERMSKSLKHKLKQVFRNDETRRFGGTDMVNIDDDDVEFIAQTVWKSRCVITQKRFGGHLMLTLTRWRADEAPTPYNLVLMMQDKAKIFAEEGKGAFPIEIVQRIEKRLEWAKKVCDSSWDSANREDHHIASSVNRYFPEFANFYAQVAVLAIGFSMGYLLS